LQIPRCQVVYTDVSFDSFTDDDGVEVSQDDSASVAVGAGVAVGSACENWLDQVDPYELPAN
jgi:outer membrane autotransporter protein